MAAGSVQVGEGSLLKHEGFVFEPVELACEQCQAGAQRDQHGQREAKP
jgi:hypothetical protein